MTDALRLAQSLIKPVAQAVISDRRQRANRSLPLAELINVTVFDDYKRRKLNREIEAMCDAVAERLEAFYSDEWSGLEDAERRLAVESVVDAFAKADLSDDAFFEVDADPVKLARRLRSTMPRTPPMSAAGEALYDRLLAESCTIYAQIAVHLASFTPRGIAESLARMSKLRNQVEQLLDRLPMRSLDAPAGTDQDEEFLRRYLDFVSTTLDHIELFGVHTRNFRTRTSLSVAYVSLSVAVDNRRASLSSAIAGENLPETNTLRVEQALAGSTRTLLTGEPGSGKTTLLQWLAIAAARGAFKADLARWNGLVPFFVRLRSYTGSRMPSPEQFLDSCPFAALTPPGWVHRVLTDGQALLLVDGVDELPVPERNAVRDWLRTLVQTYPENKIVVTARPAAATPAWLQHEGFTPAALERMSNRDVRELIAYWHAAVRSAGHLPCQEHELPGYERALLAKLETSTPLQTLATNPLLCSLLCALNLDQHTALPPDRMGIYAAALDMLLERRDVERRIASEVSLSIRNKLHLLQYLAWRLSLNNRTELAKKDAVQRITERLATMSMPTGQAESIVDHLLQRSGVIREPAVDKIDFVHRTFQEYLTAAEAAEHGDVGLLIDRAHLDAWRETVILAAGHANKPVRHELLSGLLDRADEEPRNARTLRLLAAACLETAGPLDADLRARVEECLAKLVPPRRSAEARSLAAVGRILLKHVPDDISAMTEAQTKATIEAIAWVGDDEALAILSKYARRAPHSLHRSFAELAKYFDPRKFADLVIAHLAGFLDDPWIYGRAELEAVRRVAGLQHIGYLWLDDVDSLTELSSLPSIRSLWVSGAITDVAPLVRHPEIERLVVWSSGTLTGLETLAQLPALTELILGHRGFPDIEFARSLPALTELWLRDLDAVTDFSPLEALTSLTHLDIETPKTLTSLQPLQNLPHLTHLTLRGPVPPPGGLRGVATSLPRLKKLALYESSWVRDVESIELFEQLQHLTVYSTRLSSIVPLRLAPHLRVVDLDCPLVDNLSPLGAMPKLEKVYIRDPLTKLDPVALPNKDAIAYVLDVHAARRWRRVPGQAARIKTASH
ncbi:NACHT domain-containing protein [Kibdelosporangium aridum]|uniref:NACHT domain-containing protein n=1 Tax=Kibdelosporangium aridum TaxID=2030 RepID=A0A1Y5XPL4_KIBAR|nr:NACHT domain-containing protein [Kibdelosporangium aridum]SMD10123.1 NACHT domain-containing protein [Kibdelosporangium aridum]